MARCCWCSSLLFSIVTTIFMILLFPAFSRRCVMHARRKSLFYVLLLPSPGINDDAVLLMSSDFPTVSAMSIHGA